MQDSEHIIGSYLQRKYCFLTGRGTAALYVALKAIARQLGIGEVILPTMVCPSVVYAIHYAGFKPVFVDVTRSDFTIDVASLKDRITEATKAIVAVHLFGHAAPIEEIRAVIASRRIPI